MALHSSLELGIFFVTFIIHHQKQEIVRARVKNFW